LIRRWMRETLVVRVLEGSRTTILLWAAILIAAIGVVDWLFENDVSFGFLYLFPMLMVGGCLTRWQLAGVAVLCTGLTEAFDPFPWVMPVGMSRVILTFAAFYGTGFFGFASARSRRLTNQHIGEIEREVELRRKTEEQLEFLISSSPATIFTLDADGNVLLANEAAHRLLRIEPGALQGQSIAQFFPALASVPPSREEGPTFHTEMECQGRRRDGEVFLAHVWFSTYQTKSGPRLAAVVFDSSEELRDRAEFNLQQILSGSKVLVGALCHEIRNVCGAILVVHSKLARDGHLAVNEDFGALGTLVEGLEKMAGLELRQTTQSVAESIDVCSALEELRIVIEPSFHESEMTIHWELPEFLPRVWADRQALLQAFLNLAKNSQRAMEGRDKNDLTVRASFDESSVVVRFIDTGPGVANPEQLFEPFQPGAQASGLGLYLSRTFVRAFQGDVEYEPQPVGCCFAVVLALASDQQSRTAEGA
jgi:two-component system sensor kinase FixL